MSFHALQSSGAISLDDIHVEAGGTSGTSCTINDSDIRNLIDKSSEATMSFSDFYGATSDWVVSIQTGSIVYKGVYLSTVPPSGWTSQSYLHSGSISDDTFDPWVTQGIASSSAVSTPAIIRGLYTSNNNYETFLQIWAVSEPSNSGWNSIVAEGVGNDTHTKNLSRVSASTTYNSSQDYFQYRWGDGMVPQVLFPSHSTLYDIHVFV